MMQTFLIIGSLGWRLAAIEDFNTDPVIGRRCRCCESIRGARLMQTAAWVDTGRMLLTWAA